MFIRTNRITFTLEVNAFEFLNQVGGKNKSAFVNQLILKEKRRAFKKVILKANQEEANDASYREELVGWDHTLAG